MRARLAILIALATIVGSLAMTASVAHAQPEVTLAQENQQEGDSDSSGSGNQGDEGQGGEADGGGEAAEETGPPWTYQMARISLILLFLTLLAVGFAYYRFVATRRKHGF